VKEIGGVNRAATVLSELAETMDFQNIGSDFLPQFNSAVIQRLGFILDKVQDHNII
jgi:predicted transcriptional regulator of viral defense system